MQLRVGPTLLGDHEEGFAFQLDGPTKQQIKWEDKGHVWVGAAINGDVAVLVLRTGPKGSSVSWQTTAQWRSERAGA